jgi:hypothetical protein
MAESHPKFTLSSARRALLDVRPVAESMCRVYRALEEYLPQPAASDERVDPAYFRLVKELHRDLDQLGTLGVLVQDLKRGQVDFPALRAGRPVLLCWQVGEDGLFFWHDLEGGFAARRPLDDDGPWGEPLAEKTGLP